MQLTKSGLIKKNKKITSDNTAYLVPLRFTQMLRTSDYADTLYEIVLIF